MTKAHETAFNALSEGQQQVVRDLRAAGWLIDPPWRLMKITWFIPEVGPFVDYYRADVPADMETIRENERLGYARQIEYIEGEEEG